MSLRTARPVFLTGSLILAASALAAAAFHNLDLLVASLVAFGILVLVLGAFAYQEQRRIRLKRSFRRVARRATPQANGAFSEQQPPPRKPLSRKIRRVLAVIMIILALLAAIGFVLDEMALVMLCAMLLALIFVAWREIGRGFPAGESGDSDSDFLGGSADGGGDSGWSDSASSDSATSDSGSSDSGGGSSDSGGSNC